MNRTRNIDQEVNRLLADPEFAQRTAASVEARATWQKRYRASAALAAAALVLGLSVALFTPGTEAPPGLHSEASALVAAQETGAVPWEDTDSVISAALASR